MEDKMRHLGPESHFKKPSPTNKWVQKPVKPTPCDHRFIEEYGMSDMYKRCVICGEVEA